MAKRRDLFGNRLSREIVGAKSRTLHVTIASAPDKTAISSVLKRMAALLPAEALHIVREGFDKADAVHDIDEDRAGRSLNS